MSGLVDPGAIVVGADGSEHADRAVRWAADQAHLERRRLVVAVAAGDASLAGAGWTGVIAGTNPDEIDPHLRRAQLIADGAAAFARERQPEVDVQALALPGDPREVLGEMSSTAHLVVLGSRGRGTLRSLLLGSVSAAVAGSASCPVVVCRPVPEGGTNGVIVGADGTAESMPVLDFAFAQASLHGRHLTVVHCFWDAVAAVAGFREASADALSDPNLEELRLLLAESVAGFREKYPDVSATLLLRHGLVDEALTRSGHAWDLVVVGRHRASNLQRMLTGSIATAVVERAHSNVAVVPESSP